MPSLAAYPAMMRRDRERLGLRECRAAWLLGLTVREYRALESGDVAALTGDLWDGWSRCSSGRRPSLRSSHHVSAHNPKEVPSIGQSLEFVMPRVLESEAGASDEVLDGTGDKDL
jgi:hypothetical protein